MLVKFNPDLSNLETHTDTKIVVKNTEKTWQSPQALLNGFLL